jgi:hypothetical protein
MRSWTLRARVAALEERCPPLPPSPSKAAEGRWRRRLCLVDGRLVQLLDAAEQLLTDEERRQVQEALRQWQEQRGGAYATWFKDLALGGCRLPELAPAVMKELLLAWLSPLCELAYVCQRCGLEYPRHAAPSRWQGPPDTMGLQAAPPQYEVLACFSACPGCAAPTQEIDWAHLPRPRRPWMNLDGYAAPPSASAP